MNNKFILIISFISIILIGALGGSSIFKNNKTSQKQQSKIIYLQKKYIKTPTPKNIMDTNFDLNINQTVREKESIKKDIGIKKVSVPFECPKPKKDYMDMSLLDIGQTIGLPDKTYIPKNLVELGNDSSVRTEICVTKETKEHFEEMIKKAKENGYIIKANSGFRSSSLQEIIRGNASLTNTQKEVDISIAKSGYSEHQLGTTIDLTAKSIDFKGTVSYFGETEEGIWLLENSANYGFIQSYPINKENITGYMYEPWHYRYVGIDIAKEVIKSGKTLNEYLKIKNATL